MAWAPCQAREACCKNSCQGTGHAGDHHGLRDWFLDPADGGRWHPARAGGRSDRGVRFVDRNLFNRGRRDRDRLLALGAGARSPRVLVADRKAGLATTTDNLNRHWCHPKNHHKRNESAPAKGHLKGVGSTTLQAVRRWAVSEVRRLPSRWSSTS